MANPLTDGVFLIKVRTTTAPDVFVTIGDVTSYDRSTNRATSTTRVFGRATPYQGSGSRTEGYTVTALLNPVDVGQAKLLADELAGAVSRIQVFADGSVNGFYQDVVVTSKRHGARADGDFQEITFEMGANADAVPVLTGVVI